LAVNAPSFHTVSALRSQELNDAWHLCFQFQCFSQQNNGTFGAKTVFFRSLVDNSIAILYLESYNCSYFSHAAKISVSIGFINQFCEVIFTFFKVFYWVCCHRLSLSTEVVTSSRYTLKKWPCSLRSPNNISYWSYHHTQSSQHYLVIAQKPT
jgi:hypothetical protein